MTAAYGWGLVGVLLFSVTFPATRAAASAFDPLLIACGRAAVAGVLALGVALILRLPLPAASAWRPLAVTSIGVVYGFPLCSAWALQHVTAVHAGVVTALLPLATALSATWVAGERPSPRFWLSAVLGSGVVLLFVLREGGLRWHTADLALVVAMAFAAHGYAHGARLARQLGGWQTITWVLVLTLPVNLVLSVLALAGTGAGPAPVAALLGLAYVSVFSAYVGFFPWYKGLALGGIAQVGQMQLLQPFFTVLFGALLLGEALDGALWGYLVAVIACVALGRKAG